MKNLGRKAWLLAAALCACLDGAAQFYSLGADPGGIRWSTVQTPTYRLVYPQGLDSLAQVYAVALEQAAGPVAGSIGMRPNAAYRNKMPVVIHPFSAMANGQVTWAPRRLELLTIPDAFAPEPTPWLTQLAIHESRHVAQSQAGAMKPFRWMKLLGGQLPAAGVEVLYGSLDFFEGDAVVAETALTPSGRGRTADFLEYYRVSFAAGDFRDYRRWRYGSQRWYTPDYYRAGYLGFGGIRALFDIPDLSTRFYQRIQDHNGFSLLNRRKTVQDAVGLGFHDAFALVSSSLQAQWAADEAARAPFMPSEAVSPVPRRFAEYGGLQAAGGHLYASFSSITQPARLVRVSPDGSQRRLSLLGSYPSAPRYSAAEDRLYWSEIVRDPRWELRSYSVIRSAGLDGRSRLLTRKTRYYHPVPAPDSAQLAVTEYREDGSGRVVVLDAGDGHELRSYPVPDGLQVTETAWVGGVLYANALSDEGFGLYRMGDFRTVLAPAPVKIKQLRSFEGKLLFTCDLTGVNELYSLDPDSGAAPLRLTATRFGAADFEILRDTLYYTALQPEGRLIRKTALSDLRPVAADFSVLPRYPFAETLSAGEPEFPDPDAAVELGEVKPYRKLAHLFRFHSWAPFFLDYDMVDILSLDALQTAAGLGATAFWQNDLGTAYGSIGFLATLSDRTWHNALNAHITYTGLYPVIEASMTLGGRSASLYRLETTPTPTLTVLSRNIPSVTAFLRTYIPWNFSSGGWLRGVVPSATLSLSNDITDQNQTLDRTTLGLRAYLMQRTPVSRVYPRLGIGAELGYSFRWNTDWFAPSGFAYLYGYLPGLHETHGLRWATTGVHAFQKRAVFSERFADATPRGFGTEASRAVAAYRNVWNVALDYKLPLLPVDRAIAGDLAYLRNFELTLHGDYTGFRSPSFQGNLYSIGADLAAVLGNFLWIPYTCRAGVTYNLNGGASFDDFDAAGISVKKHHIELFFNVEL